MELVKIASDSDEVPFDWTGMETRTPDTNSTPLRMEFPCAFTCMAMMRSPVRIYKLVFVWTNDWVQQRALLMEDSHRPGSAVEFSHDMRV